MTRIPSSALLLGLAGLIPFLWGAATTIWGPLGQWSLATFGAKFSGTFLLQGYGIVILAFMSGVIWGFATRAHGAVATTAYALSVLPALWAFFMGTGAPGPALVALAAGFLAVLALDWMFWNQGLAPDWWMRLRLLLTGIVVVCLGVGAFVTDAGTITVYTERADQYAALRMSDAEARSLAAFAAGLPPATHVLDLGCGPGLQALHMQAAGHTVLALDPTPAFVEIARDRGVDAHPGSFDDIPDTAGFGAVVASFSLLHAPRADFPRHLAAIARALTPGGQLYLGMKLGQGEARDAIGRAYSFYSQEELTDHLATAGFTVTRAETGEGCGLAGTVDPYVVITAHA